MSLNVKSIEASRAQQGAASSMQERTEQSTQDRCGKAVLNILQNSTTPQDLFQQFHMDDRRKIIEVLLALGPLPDNDMGQALILAMQTPLLTQEDRTVLVDEILENETIPPVYLGQAICIAIEHLNSELVERLLRKGPIPDAGAAGGWQQAVKMALEKSANSIVERLFACENISSDSRCQAFYAAFFSGYKGRLEQLLSLVPDGENFRPILSEQARVDGFGEIADELMVIPQTPLCQGGVISVSELQ